MSALMRSPECGDGITYHPVLGTLLMVPRHDECPGGQSHPGLIGGWTCSCDCHLNGGSDPEPLKAADGNAPSEQS